MALCNHTSREIFFNFAFCGPEGSGKASTLNFIHQKLDPHFRGGLEQVTLDRGDQSLQMEVLPVESTRIANYRLRLQLKTLTGPTLSNRSLLELVEGVDGIIFVADSSPDRQAANIESLQSVRQALESNRLDPDLIPTIFQFNKRDIQGAVDPETIDEHLSLSHPSFLTCAHSGYQIMSTFDALLHAVLKDFDSRAVLNSHTQDAVALSR